MKGMVPTLRFRRSLAGFALLASLPIIFLYLHVVRPPTPFYALPLASIALAAVLHEFTGGTLAALIAMAAAALLIALDPLPTRRAVTLQEAWPILTMYLAVGPVVGWLAARERERERGLASAAHRLKAVQEIAQAISTSLDLEHTLRTIIAETRRLVAFERAAVLLQEGAGLRVVALSEGYERPQELIGRKFPLKGTAAGWSIRHRRIRSLSPGDAVRFPDARQLCPPAKPCLIVPLHFQRRGVGAFLLGGQALDDPSPIDRDMLSQIGRHMAIAIANARLYETERQWSRRLAAIGDACREISAALDLDRALRLIMAKAVETLPMDAGALFQFDAKTQTFRVMVSHNLSPEHVSKITFGFEEGVPGWVVKHRRPLLVRDALADRRVHPYVREDGVHSVLATPMIAREKVVGVLNLYSKSRRGAFNADAVRLAEIYSAQAAIAIENAGLVEALRRAATELEARVDERTRQLRASQAQAIRSEKLAVVGRLAASVAHEVNNPLQAVELQLQLIADEALDPAVRGRLAIAQDEMARISAIVRRLLEFQRPSPGERSAQDLACLLDEVLALTDKQLQRSGVEVIRSGPGSLKPVLAAGDQIKQVFLNLILNAVEAMPQGGQLGIRVYQDAGRVSVAFHDTGVGMPSEVVAHLFEPFISTKPDGTGLGLAVSHEIISQHGGELEAGSAPGQGATFTVRLPVYQAEESRGALKGC